MPDAMDRRDGDYSFTLAVIPMLNHSGGMQMFNAEVTGITHDKKSVHEYRRLPRVCGAHI